MLLGLDLHGIENESNDFTLLQAYLQQLVGQPLLHLRFSYGDELSLHFGRTQPYLSPKLKHLVKGSYILGTRASQWFLHSESRALVLVGAADSCSFEIGMFRPLEKEDIETGEFIQPGVQVVCCTVAPSRLPLPRSDPKSAVLSHALSLQLSDGSSIVVAPEPTEIPTSGEMVADWELFTPHERVLRAGPGDRWSYLPSRQPSSQQPA